MLNSPQVSGEARPQPLRPLAEADCGISGYVGASGGFYGLVKQRFSDFHVHEIGLDGRVCKLDLLYGQEQPSAPADAGAGAEAGRTGDGKIVPGALANNAMSQGEGAIEECDSEKIEEREEEEVDPAKALLEAALQNDELKQSAEELFGPDVARAFLEFVRLALAREEKTFWFPETGDRELRRKTHNLVRDSLGDFFVSATKEFDQDGDQVKQTHKKDRPRRICVRRNRSAGKSRGSKEGGDFSRDSRKRPPEFVSFVLYKENAETMACIHELSRKTRISTGSFSWAGTKDKRGITSQRCTMRRRLTQDLARFSRPPKGSDLRTWGGWRVRGGRFLLGNFEETTKDIRLGDLYGNRFDVILRRLRLKDGTGDVRPTEDYIRGECEALRKGGFINFFGMQRFGMGPVGRGTADVGRLLLQRRWEDAVRAILGHATGDKDEVTAAKDLYLKAGDARGAYQAMPRFMNIERIVLKMLGQCQNGYLNAVMKLPKNSWTMYLHAYQSRLWNQLAHERIRRLGTNVVAGDLVLLPSPVGEGEPLKRRFRGVPHVVSEEEASSGAYTMKDVVLPLAGFDVMMPTTEIAGLFKLALEEDGLTLEGLRNDSQPALSIGGDYRRVMCFMEDFQYEVVQYSGVEDPLLVSDFESLANAASRPGHGAKPKDHGEAPKDMPESKSAEDDLVDVGLRLSFTLPLSAYATMAIRELTKESSERGGSNYTFVGGSSGHIAVDEPKEAQKAAKPPEELEGVRLTERPRKRARHEEELKPVHKPTHS